MDQSKTSQDQGAQAGKRARTEGEINPGTATGEPIRYGISLRFHHPSAKLPDLTEKLDWDPYVEWQVGDAWQTSDGRLLGSGVRKQSYWCGSEYRENEPEFMRNVVEIIEHVEDRGSFAADFVRDGGMIDFYVCLHGGLAIGDTIEADELVRMARLGIDLGLEILPDFNREPLP